MGTQQGSDPLRPEFGLDLVGFVDMPLPRAIARLRRDIIKQIGIWEPRVTVTKVTLTQPEAGQLEVSVAWNLKNSTAGPQATITTLTI